MTDTKPTRIPVAETALRSMQISREEAEEFRRKQAETMQKVEQLEQRLDQACRRFDEFVTGEPRFNAADLRGPAGLGGADVRGDKHSHA